MPEHQQLERLLARQINNLRALIKNEGTKREAIGKADLDAAVSIQESSDSIFQSVENLDREIAQLKSALASPDRPAEQVPKIKKLNHLLMETAKEAQEANQQNQKLLKSLLGEMKQQIALVRKGRQALIGYQKSLKGAKQPRILSGDV